MNHPVESKNLFQRRKSHRKFDKNQPIPQTTLENILTDALRAPSWSNTQPWEVFVAAGSTLEEIREAYLAAFDRSEPYNTDVPVPKEWPEYMQERSIRNSIHMFECMGIDREDEKARELNRRNNISFFDGTALSSSARNDRLRIGPPWIWAPLPDILYSPLSIMRFKAFQPSTRLLIHKFLERSYRFRII